MTPKERILLSRREVLKSLVAAISLPILLPRFEWEALADQPIEETVVVIDRDATIAMSMNERAPFTVSAVKDENSNVIGAKLVRVGEEIASSGVEEGDIIYKVNGQSVSEVTKESVEAAMHDMIEAVVNRAGFSLELMRQGKPMRLTFVVE
jgi:hypothetical protein